MPVRVPTRLTHKNSSISQDYKHQTVSASQTSVSYYSKALYCYLNLLLLLLLLLLLSQLLLLLLLVLLLLLLLQLILLHLFVGLVVF